MMGKQGILGKMASCVLHPQHVVLCDPSDEQLKNFVCELPNLFRTGQGRVLYKHRNELRIFQLGDRQMVVKSFGVPNVTNRLAYGLLRKSKAQRSYEYARLLNSLGIGSPEPVAWLTIRNGLLFTHSYYVSLLSTCPYTYTDLQTCKISPRSEEERYLRLVARAVARLHDNGMIHRDLSQGNVLFGDGDRVEFIDLNRIRFRDVGLVEGCKNLSERLLANRWQRAVLAEEYAKARGFDAEECLRLVNQYNVIKD
ncbi:MAG: hypothetical protein IJ762_03490 [Bacteroidaceae bacterium]|nr:hypothetical protein [Bacteroidaceae bacterium]